RGSLGIDLAAAVTVTLIDRTVQKIPTGVHGPLVHVDSWVGALLLGRSSSGLAELVVLPGVIDADYTGKIYVCAYALSPPLIIEQGTRIAQLVLIGNLYPSEEELPTCGHRNFGSSGQPVISLVQKMKSRPMVNAKLALRDVEHSVSAMMDTGADVTIIS
ncbi:POK9 protein, partial [Callaeas wilsoni]|nr:POK9 protein [Callaeas wilsoni]